MKNLSAAIVTLLIVGSAVLVADGIHEDASSYPRPNVTLAGSVDLGVAPSTNPSFFPPPPFATGDMFYTFQTGSEEEYVLVAVNVTSQRKAYSKVWYVEDGAVVPQLLATETGLLVVVLDPENGALIFDHHGTNVRNVSHVETLITIVGSTLYYAKPSSTMAWRLDVATGHELPQQQWMSDNPISKYVAMVGQKSIFEGGGDDKDTLGFLGVVTSPAGVYPLICNMSLFSIATSTVTTIFNQVGCESSYLGSDSEFFYVVNKTGSSMEMLPQYILMYPKISSASSLPRLIPYDFKDLAFSSSAPARSTSGDSLTIAVTNVNTGYGSLLVIDLAHGNVTKEVTSTSLSFTMSSQRAYIYSESGAGTSNISTYTYPGAQLLSSIETPLSGGYYAGFITMALSGVGCQLTGGMSGLEVRVVNSGEEVFTQNGLYSNPAMPSVNPIVIPERNRFVVANYTDLLVFTY